MEQSAALPAEEVTRLQRCINDLVSVLAFPAIWSGRSPSQMVTSFLDGLLRVLQLDVAYARVVEGSGTALECLRAPPDVQPQVPALAEWFAGLGDDPAQWPSTYGAEGAVVAIETVRLGLPPGKGLVAVGSRRSGFPYLTEKLLLHVAANQLLIGLQEAQLRVERERTARELELRQTEDHRRLTDEALGKARAELANVARVSSLGVLTASIAHEVNQPLSGIMTNAGTCLRMLSTDPPNIEGALETARRTIRDSKRASDVISRLRTLYTRKELQFETMDLNEALREVISLFANELQDSRVTLHQELQENLPPVDGDRIQLQQVMLNLVRNALDSLQAVADRPRELLIRTEADTNRSVRLSVRDSGVGFTAQTAERIFEPFYTTKDAGMGIGLSVSRSIIEAHHGRLWAAPNDGPGAMFAFSLSSLPAAAVLPGAPGASGSGVHPTSE